MTQNTTGDISADATASFKIHLLDLGRGSSHQYGDCVLCQFGSVSVLIDGGHSNDAEIILPQLQRVLNQSPSVHVSLIITTHPHDDHIGCLPRLVADGQLTTDWALLTDPQYRWGNPGDTDTRFALRPGRMRSVAEAVLEHDRSDMPDDELTPFIDNLGNLETRYRMMIDRLRSNPETTVVLHGEDETALLAAFTDIGLKIIGPTRAHLEECARLVRETTDDSFEELDQLFAVDSPVDVATIYRSMVAAPTDAVPRNRGAMNLQSIVTSFKFKEQRILFGGDMQFSDPQVDSQLLIDGVRRMRQDISADAPYAFVKLSHHGSDNGFSEEILAELGDTRLYGICLGDARGHHPHPDILDLLDENRERIDWVRTDRNGLVTITIRADGAQPPELTHGHIDDATPNTFDDTDFFVSETVSRTANRDGAGIQTFAETSGSAGSAASAEIYARVPSNAARVSFSVDLTPGSAPVPTEAGSAPDFLSAGKGHLLSAAEDVMADVDQLGPSRSVLLTQLNRTRSRGWLPFFNDAASQFSFPVALLLAIASRESNIQNILGDGGHGRGIMQIDDRSFPDFANSGRWRDPRLNILMGARVLSGKQRFLSQRGVDADVLKRASVAAYNSGEGNVLRAIRRGLSVDTFTANRNYSADVLGRAAVFSELLS
ncbi:MAG TPA: transglycosylase SLT domain-containing protein [Pyrinomonadaceae bacterium]|nr:transglycosylase SLT domain-containing protein [Pyrinomonadaceae bacterium]